MMEPFERLVDVLENHNYLDLKRYIKEFTEKLGWIETAGLLTSALLHVYGFRWFSHNRVIMRLFDLEGLEGYDGDILQFIKQLDDSNDWNQVEEDFRQNIISSIGSSLESYGSTFFFDVELLKRTKADILIPQIVQIRRQELRNVVTSLYQEGLIDEPLKLKYLEYRNPQFHSIFHTYYGLTILQSERDLSYTKISSAFNDIIQTANIANLEYDETKPLYIQERTTNKISDLVESIMILFLENNEDHSKSFQLTNLLTTGYFDLTHTFNEITGKDTSPIWLCEYAEYGWDNSYYSIIDASLVLKTKDAFEIISTFIQDGYPLPICSPVDWNPTEEILKKLVNGLKDYDHPILPKLAQKVFDSIGWIDREEGGMAWLTGLDWDIVEVAIDIAKKNPRESYRKPLVNMVHAIRFEPLKWHNENGSTSTIGLNSAKALISIYGERAVPSLLDYICWFYARRVSEAFPHPEYDNRIISLIIELGESSISKMVDHLFEMDKTTYPYNTEQPLISYMGIPEQLKPYWRIIVPRILDVLNEFDVEGLERIGGFLGGIKEIDGKILEMVFSIATVLQSKVGWDWTTWEWFNHLGLQYDKKSIHYVLKSNSPLVRKGLIDYLYWSADIFSDNLTDILDLLVERIEFEDEQRFRTSDYIESGRLAVNLADVIKETPETLLKFLKSRKWSKRVAALYILVVLERDKTIHEKLNKIGMGFVLEEISKWDSNNEDAMIYEYTMPTMNPLFRRAYTLGKYLPFRIFDDKWIVTSVLKGLGESEFGWFIVEYVVEMPHSFFTKKLVRIIAAEISNGTWGIIDPCTPDEVDIVIEKFTLKLVEILSTAKNTLQYIKVIDGVTRISEDTRIRDIISHLSKNISGIQKQELLQFLDQSKDFKDMSI